MGRGRSRQASLNYVFGSTATKFITAVYSGDANFVNSTSPLLTQAVTNGTGIATSTTLSVNANPASVGQQVTLTAAVISPQCGAEGTVSFWKNETNLIGTAPLVFARSVAAINFTFESTGLKPITAIYSGDAACAPSAAGSTATVQ
jgi:hypothetical protein